MADERDLPQVPQGVDSQLRRVLEAWRGEIQRLMGFRGADDDKAVRWRDLDEYGLRERLGGTVIGGTLLPGTGVGTGGGTATEPDYTPPPSPTGVTLTSTFSHILVSFDMPTYTQGHGHQRTNIYAVRVPSSSTSQPTRSLAVVWDRVYSGSIIAIPSDFSIRWHVWLTHESVDGVESMPAGGVNGFTVETGRDVDMLLTALTGSITSSELHTSLGARISLIDGPDSMAGSVAARMLAEAIARGAAITAEQMARANADSAIAGSVTTLAAQVGGSGGENLYMGNYLLEAGPGVYGVVGSILKSGGNNPYQLLSGETLTISAELWQDSESLSAGQVSTLFIYAAVANGGWVVAGVISSSALSPERKYTSLVLPADADMHTVGVSLYHQGGATNISGAVFARRIQVERGEVATAYKAQSSVQAAAIQAANTARVDGDYALAQSINTLSASVGENSTAIQQEATARANVDGHLSTLYTVRTSLTSGGRTVIGGFGLSGTSSATAGATIDFGVRADRFWIGAPNDGSAPGIGDVMPFVVQATPTTINGVPVPAGVYINELFVRNASIKNLMIDRATADRLQVVDADIIDLSATKITAGTLGVQRWISSIGYQPGQTGWAIFADGRAEFGAAHIRGQLVASQIDTRGLSIKDASGNIILAAGSALPAAYAAPGTMNSDVVDGSNVVYNSDLGQGRLNTWSDAINADFGLNLSADWQLAPAGSVGTNVGWCHQTVNTGNADNYCEVASEPFPVEGNTRMFATAYTGAHRCPVYLFAYFFNDMGLVGHSFTGTARMTNSMEQAGGRSLTGYKRLLNIMDVPAGATSARLILRKMETVAGNSDSWMFYTRLSCTKVSTTAAEPGPWAPSGLANPTNLSAANPITPANVSTYIQAAAIGDAYIGNFIKSFNFNGTINTSTGAITSVGTTGWAISKTGKMVVDAADIRGLIRADQVESQEVTTANLTSGTMRNVSGTTFINLNATGSDIVFRAGAFDPMLGRYAVQIRADGDAQFSKLISYSTWSGSELIFSRHPNGDGILTLEKDSHEFFIDTGYSLPAGIASEREFSCRMASATATYNSSASVVAGDITHLMQISLSTARGVVSFRNGAAQNQSQNPFGAGNDRIYIRVFIKVPRVDIPDWVDIRLTSLQWRLYFGM